MLLSEAIAWLSEVYGVQYPQEVTQYPPTKYNIHDNISAGYPVFGRWDGGSWNHATVIRGVSVVYDYISMMDPEAGYVTVSTKGCGPIVPLKKHIAHTFTHHRQTDRQVT